jgi:hypothetical protein
MVYNTVKLNHPRNPNHLYRMFQKISGQVGPAKQKH